MNLNQQLNSYYTKEESKSMRANNEKIRKSARLRGASTRTRCRVLITIRARAVGSLDLVFNLEIIDA
ncbi:hypothetical protein GBA52_003683 [Prunus armeniaca]|nr:hypothetical protein GBA52_003683 [Prunus armeniaca]